MNFKDINWKTTIHEEDIEIIRKKFPDLLEYRKECIRAFNEMRLISKEITDIWNDDVEALIVLNMYILGRLEGIYGKLPVEFLIEQHKMLTTQTIANYKERKALNN